jgi:hypothetical protein
MVTERLGYADYQPGRVGSEAGDNGVRESEVGKRAAQDLREWEGVPIEDRMFAALVRPPRKTSFYTEYVCARSCSTCSLENCVSKGITCHGFGGSTSGSGGSGTGYDDGGYPTTGSIPTIPPDDPDDGPGPVRDEPVSKAEVATALREACDLPPSTGQNEDVMSDIFQASVNASFNASSPSSHASRTGVHHQHPDELDGFATAAFDMQDGGQLDLLTGIIETKFTEDPSNGIRSGQSRGHIRSLYSTYNLIPSGATFTGAPVYAVVTNSQVPVEMIGRYSEGAGQYDLVTYANDWNVKFVHYRVMRTFLENLKLEGDILGNAQTTRSAIQDFLGDFDVDFVIDCTPAEN